MNKLKPISCVSMLFLLTACGGGAKSTSNFAAASPNAVAANSNESGTILKNDFFLMRMGSGFDSVTHTATSGQTCLVNASNPDNIYIGNPSAMVTFEHEIDISQLQNALNVNVSGGFGGDRFGVSVAAEFANASKDTGYTTNLLYLYKYAGKSTFKDGSLGEGLAALTPYAASLEQTSPSGFRKMCGNRFVSQMDAGLSLGVRLSLRFNSHSDQEQFKGQIKGDIGLANIAVAIQQAAANSHVHVEMILSAIQLGGQPEKLNQIFGVPDASGNYPFLNCSSENTDAVNSCKLMISNIVAYSQTLSTQLGSTNSLFLDRLYYTNPTIMEYSDLGIPTNGAPDPSPEILAAMQELTHQYDDAVYDYNFVSHYMTTLSDKMDTPLKEDLRDASQRLNNQINNVFLLPVYDLVDCYRGYVSTRCLTIRDNVESALVEYELRPTEANLIPYLETNSYSGSILNYYGGATPTQGDYHASKCIFAPVSDPMTALYAIYCNGSWLTTNASGVNIFSDFTGKNLYVNDLIYTSTPPDSTANGQLIQYDANITLPISAYYNNYFYESSVKVSAPASPDSNVPLGLTKLYENQA